MQGFTKGLIIGTVFGLSAIMLSDPKNMRKKKKMIKTGKNVLGEVIEMFR